MNEDEARMSNLIGDGEKLSNPNPIAASPPPPKKPEPYRNSRRK